MSADPGAATDAVEIAAPVPAPRENVYGSVKRLDWIRSQIRPGDRVVDLGCGTGFMITLPLLREGVDVTGVDLDAGSVALGRRILTAAGEDPERLREQLLETVEGSFDVASSPRSSSIRTKRSSTLSSPPSARSSVRAGACS